MAARVVASEKAGAPWRLLSRGLAGGGAGFGARQVERVLPFDIAGAHVVADGIAEDAAGGRDQQGQLGLRHIPGGIGADADGFAGTGDSMRRGLEEELGALGLVDAIVEAFSSGGFRLGHAGGAAAVIGDAGGPDL